MNGPAVTGPFVLGTALAEREQVGLLRNRIATDGASGGRLRVAGRDYLNFSANDYLGLADHGAIKAAFNAGIERYGTGSGASPLVTGYSRAHQQLEETLAEWLGVEAVLLFNCGFSANQAVLKALLGKEHLLWQDKLNHASLQEMGSQLPCKMKRFAHNDMAALERQLEPNRGLIVSEGVFSMDGDQAPWGELATLAARSGNWLMIDDAHGLGVLGPRGAAPWRRRGFLLPAYTSRWALLARRSGLPVPLSAAVANWWSIWSTSPATMSTAPICPPRRLARSARASNWCARLMSPAPILAS